MSRFHIVAGCLTALALYGCGKVKDQPEPDASIDAPAAPVTVTTLSTAGDGQIDPSATVVFVDGAGVAVRTTMVDDKGKAEAMLAGGKVHALRVTTTGTARNIVIQTVAGVRPGDAITFGLLPRPGFRGGATTTMTGSFTPLTGYSSYSFAQDCALTAALSPATTFSASLSETCRDGQIELLAVAAATDLPDRFVYTSFAHAAGGAFTVPNNWATMSNFALTVSDVPAEVTSLSSVRLTYLSATGRTAVSGAGVTFTGDPPAGTSSLTLPYPATAGARALVNTTFGNTAAVASHVLSTRTATVTSALVQNAAALPLPWITTRPVPSATGVTWAQTGAGTPDLRLVTWVGRFTGSDGLVNTVTWYMADDGTGPSSVTLPGLPAELAAFDPTKQMSMALLAEVALVDRSDLASYAEARRNMLEYSVTMQAMGLDVEKAFQMRRTEAAGRIVAPALTQ